MKKVKNHVEALFGVSPALSPVKFVSVSGSTSWLFLLPTDEDVTEIKDPVYKLSSNHYFESSK